MAGNAPPRLLILGGTGEAAALARALAGRFGAALWVMSSRAGRTQGAAALPGHGRVGGFGGTEGLRRFLVETGIDAVIDATHPFAARISAHARGACGAAGVSRLVLARPPWRQRPGDRWIEVADATAAAVRLGQLGRRAFLTVGARDLPAFAGLADVWCLVRLVERPAAALPLADYRLIVDRGPFDLANETSLFADNRIDVLVSKASGGSATAAKLTAARAAGCPVVMLRRPPVEPGERVDGIDAAVDWVAASLLSHIALTEQRS